ncbi:MAG: ATP-dependent DNA helicase RecQ [Cyclobacteriaceae bacterium]|jgi:ATP-dependent DNA helicase RecQ
MSVNTPLEILKQYWSFPAFRDLQDEIIDSVINGKHTLALLPTGGGKSICFQVPGLYLDGICIVISPLIALMKDQVFQLKKRGIKATALYSGMSHKEIDFTLDNCIYGNIKFLYVSPERLKTELFIERARQMNIGLLAIDEAHCISQWGYDFRPPYLEISDFIEELEIKKIIALTASATKEVKEDILKRLNLTNPVVFQKSFARANLSYSVFNLENKDQKMLEILTNVKGSAIVYVRSRKKTKSIADFLKKHKISSDFYHAGLASDIRSKKQDLWIQNKVRVIVSTNAFGMGIDKPDVRSVIHYDLPDSLEAYYQEAGRAGRDEKKAYAVALYHKGDLNDLESRTEQMAVGIDLIKRVYQALANYYKLAVGSKALSSFEFDYLKFTSNFNLPTVETYYALNKLQDEGLIQVSDSFNPTSRIIFIQSHQDVYKFQVANETVDHLVKGLMRLYGGELFINYININEKELARMLKESEQNVYKQLDYLHQMEMVEYQKSSDKPQITFLTPRFDTNNLPLNKEQIVWRRQVAFEKTKSVVGYMTSLKTCRTRIIQTYFDEIPTSDCEICDVCLNKKKTIANAPINEVKLFLMSGPKTFPEIILAQRKFPAEKVETAIRYLLDLSQITLDEDKYFLQP